MNHQETWFRALEESFHSCPASLARVESWYRIGGLPVRLLSVGPAPLEVVDRAIEHLRLPGRPTAASGTPEQASLTVLLFDGADATVAVPPPPGRLEDFTARGDILGFNTERFKAAFQPFGRILSAFDVERELGICCFGAADKVLSFEKAAPLRSMFAWWARLHGLQLLHAAAVGTTDGGLLLVGKGGSGKSNTALACLASSLGFAGDDVCAVGMEDGDPVAHSLYATARTRPQDWKRLPFLEALSHQAVGPGEDEKALYFLLPAFARQMIRRVPVRAILLPRVGGGPSSRLQPASPTAALLAIAPVTTTLLPDAGPEIFQSVGQLVRRVPCYDLQLGTDVAGLQALLIDLLARLDVAATESDSAAGQ